jgi:hypothetical protein
LVRDHHVTTLIEPFTGLGSAGLAARNLGVAYLGAERSRPRTLQARSKAFLTLPLLDTLADSAGGDGELLATAPATAAGENRGWDHLDRPDDLESLRSAVQETLRGLAERYSSVTAALGVMRADLAGAPPACRGWIHEGDFRDVRPRLSAGEAALYHLCPPFPQFEQSDLPVTRADGVVFCRTPPQFEALTESLARWLGEHVRPQDVVVSEYFNFVPGFDTGTQLARQLEKTLPYVQLVPASAQDEEGTVVSHPTGYCGFILASRSRLLAPPAEWFGPSPPAE